MWQMRELGLHPQDTDLVVSWVDVPAITDQLLQDAFGAGPGVLVLGESHREAGTHGFVKAMLRHSEVVDCLLLEHPAEHQALLADFMSGAPCEDSWGLAESQIFDSPEPVCRRDLRYRMLKVASRQATATYAVDDCYTCEPLAVLRRLPGGVVVGTTPAQLADLVLRDRNAFMASVILDIFEEQRCTVAILLTGRAHVEVPEVWDLGPVAGVGDHLRGWGMPAIDLPIIDINGELRGIREPRPVTARFTVREGVYRGIFLE